ncbi:MAG: ABC transporter ATP-binding protein [Candidatus Hermodarchaeota archaeon]
MFRKSPYLQVSNIEKIYGTKSNSPSIVLSEINFSVDQGEILLIFGVSGSGKSTLLNIISGLEYPSKGRIIMNENDLSDFTKTERTIWRKKEVGIVFQFFELHEGLTTRETIELALLINDYPKNKFDDRVDYLLDKFNLRGKELLSVDVLSRGEQQRVAIARALSGNPSLIIADEPTGALDHSSAENLFNLLRKLTIDENVTLLLSTHDINLIQDGVHLIILENGRIIEEVANVNRRKFLIEKGFKEIEED